MELMELSREKRKNYRKSLFTLQDVVDKLLGYMQGHGCPYRRETTNGKGWFDPEKLRGLVEELLSGWEEVRYGLGMDLATGENLAEPLLSLAACGAAAQHNTPPAFNTNL